MTRAIPPLFKFMSENRTAFFSSPQLLFSYPERFNDAFDCEPQLKGCLNPTKMEDETNATITKIQTEAPEILEILYDITKTFCDAFGVSIGEPKALDITRDDYIKLITSPQSIQSMIQKVVDLDQKEHFPKTIETIKSKIKSKKIVVFCLSESINDHQMWGLYSSENRGFAVSLDTSHKFFNLTKIKNSPLARLQKVSYRRTDKTQYLIDYIENDQLNIEKFFKDAIFVKQHRWKYEREWRIVLPSDLHPSKNITHSEAGIIFSIAPSIVTGVYLGERASDNVREAATQFCSKHGTPLFQMVRTPDQAFTAEPVALGI